MSSSSSSSSSALLARPHRNSGSNPYEINVPPPPTKLIPKNMKQIELESLPSNDLSGNYTIRSFPSAFTFTRLDLDHVNPQPHLTATPHLPRPTRTLPRGNRGHKLSHDGPLHRLGRMYPWSPLVVEELYGNPWGYGGEIKRIEREKESRVRSRLRGVLRMILPGEGVEVGGVGDGKDGVDDEDEEDDDDDNLPVAARGTKRKRKDDAPVHLRSPSPDHRQRDIISSLSLLRPDLSSSSSSSPGSLLPASTSMGTTYLDLSTSPAIRYTLGVAPKEKALMRTVDDLIDGETGLKGVLSRLLRVMEIAGREKSRLFDTKGGSGGKREVASGRKVDEMVVGDHSHVDDSAAESTTERPTVVTVPDVKMEIDDDDEIKPKPTPTSTPNPNPATTALVPDPSASRSRQPSSSTHPPTSKPALDSSFLFGSGEPFFVPPGSVVTYEPVDPCTTTQQDHPDIIDVYPPTDLNPLQRLFVTPTGLTTTIGPSPQDPRLHLPLTHPGYPHTTCVRLTPETQKQSVICAMDKIKELASDCQEYVRRLEEIRERLANVGRARRKVWQIVRERAILANEGEIGDGEADVETMRLRAEAEHAIAGSQVETRRRRGVATAVASAVVS